MFRQIMILISMFCVCQIFTTNNSYAAKKNPDARILQQVKREIEKFVRSKDLKDDRRKYNDIFYLSKNTQAISLKCKFEKNGIEIYGFEALDTRQQEDTSLGILLVKKDEKITHFDADHALTPSSYNECLHETFSEGENVYLYRSYFSNIQRNFLRVINDEGKVKANTLMSDNLADIDFRIGDFNKDGIVEIAFQNLCDYRVNCKARQFKHLGLSSDVRIKELAVNSKVSHLYPQIGRRSGLYRVYLVKGSGELEENRTVLTSQAFINEAERYLEYLKYIPNSSGIDDRAEKYQFILSFMGVLQGINDPATACSYLQKLPSFMKSKHVIQTSMKYWKIYGLNLKVNLQNCIIE